MFDLAKPKRLGYSPVTSLRVGEVRFQIYARDHLPRHAHAFIGCGEVIVELRDDGSVALARRRDALRDVSRAEMRKVLTAAALVVDQLIRLWEVMHNG